MYKTANENRSCAEPSKPNNLELHVPSSLSAEQKHVNRASASLRPTKQSRQPIPGGRWQSVPSAGDQLGRPAGAVSGAHHGGGRRPASCVIGVEPPDAGIDNEEVAAAAAAATSVGVGRRTCWVEVISAAASPQKTGPRTAGQQTVPSWRACRRRDSRSVEARRGNR